MISLALTETGAVKFTGKTFSYKDIIRAIPGSRWEKKDKHWAIPLESVQDALRILPTINLTSEVKEAYKKLIGKQEQAVAVKHIDESKVSRKVNGLKGELYPYQAVGKAFLDTLDSGQGDILAFDMGLGKSLTSLAYGLDLINKGIIDHILVVCPSKLKYATWAKEVEKWTTLDYIVIDGEKAEKVEWDDGTVEKLEGRPLREVQYQQYLEGAKVIIMNYELFLSDVEQEGKVSWVKEHTLKKKEREELTEYIQWWSQENARIEEPGDPEFWADATRDFLADRCYDTERYELRSPKRPYLARKEDASYRIIPNIDDRWLVILDEAHRIKNPKSQITKNMIRVLDPAGRKVLGTGTPLENNIQELWTLTNFCRKDILGSYYKFIERYVEVDFFGSPIAPKPQMIPELMNKLEPIMLRKTKAEALPDLPPLTVMNYPVEMTKRQKELYSQVKEGIIEIAKEAGTDFTYLEALAQITRLQQLCDSPALLRKVFEDDSLPEESGKLNDLANILSEINPKENKFILFSQYSEMTDILHKWLQDNNILRKEQIGYVKGGINARRIEEVRKGFQEGDIQCVLMTTAGNYGLDLYEATYVICFDQLFNPQKMEQIYSRAHRNGAKKPITAINLITKDSYEENKLDILERKRDLFKAVIENDEDVLQKFIGSPQDLLDLM